jgi:cobalt-zinc-cadmium efflux system outer membrane protein
VAAQRRAVHTEVTSVYQAYRLRLAALQELEEAARHVEENETLARRSYEEGQIGLAELLLVRRETVEARLVHLERRLAVAEAEVDLMARAGVVR